MPCKYLFISCQQYLTESPFQIYCCIVHPADDLVRFEDTGPRLVQNLNKTSFDHNSIKPLHSNNIDRQQRQKRSDDYEHEQDNTYDLADDSLFVITINGKHFNTTLSHSYMTDNNNFNISYNVPISKYMPDEFITITFR